MNERRLKGMLGLCVRAGQGIFGEDTCLRAVREGKASLMLADDGISSSAFEKLERLCSRENVPLFRLPAGLLEEATGKPGKTMAVRGDSFPRQITGCLEAEPDGNE